MNYQPLPPPGPRAWTRNRNTDHEVEGAASGLNPEEGARDDQGEGGRNGDGNGNEGREGNADGSEDEYRDARERGMKTFGPKINN